MQVHTTLRSTIQAALVTLVLAGLPSLSRIANAQSQPVIVTPVHIHIDQVVFTAANQPDVDLRPTIHSMGIAIKDQGARGTCSVFAMNFLLEYMFGQHLVGFPHPNFSEEYLNDVKNIATGEDSDGGFFTEIALGYQEYGIVATSLDPYQPVFDPHESVPLSLLVKGERYAGVLQTYFIRNWQPTTGLTPSQLSEILGRLRLNTPVAAGLMWPNHFATENILGIPLMKTPGPSGVSGGHSIDFVGFRQDAHFPGGGYLIFRNSWGPSFQENGYGYMSFEYA